MCTYVESPAYVPLNTCTHNITPHEKRLDDYMTNLVYVEGHLCIFLHFEDSHKKVELNEQQYGPVFIKATPAIKTFHQDTSGPAGRNSG